MEAKVWRFGFVMSYPHNTTDITGYMYEPLHYRYVSREAAAAIHEAGVTIRERLWSRGAAQT